MILDNYKTLVFDCDGVILNSNKVKTEAFFKSALPYGELAANTLVSYHKDNGGISRYKKFSHFLEEIVPKNVAGPSLDELLDSYAYEVKKGLLTCEITPSLEDLRNQTIHTKWMIISGGDQQELREVFELRKISYLFDGGIFGSPDTKSDILTREILLQNIVMPGLFFGDSRYDHISAFKAGLDFVFLSKWSEFSDLESYSQINGLKVFSAIRDLYFLQKNIG